MPLGGKAEDRCSRKVILNLNARSLRMPQCRDRWIWDTGVQTHLTYSTCSLVPLVRLAGSGRSCFSVQEAKRRIQFRKVSWASWFYSNFNYQKTKIFSLLGFSSNLCSAPSVPVPWRGDVAFPTLALYSPSTCQCSVQVAKSAKGVDGKLDEPFSGRHQKSTAHDGSTACFPL